jgi:DNA-binding response OmpR family regulator
MARIVLVEDSDSIREMVVEYFRISDHEVIEFSTGEGVIPAIENTRPDVCILDLMVPVKGGFQIAKEIRAISDVPIVFLTARDDEGSRITGFEIGADDYVVKPFSPRELVLRVDAILRRVQSQGDSDSREPLRFELDGNTLEVHVPERRAISSGSEVVLTTTEWEILSHMVAHPDLVISREQLMNAVLEYSIETSSRTIDSHIKNIRAKLGEHRWIETVRGVGYRFVGTREKR